MLKITLPLTNALIKKLNAGDRLQLTGVIYTARDQAHKRLSRTLARGRSLPVNVKGELIYYCGPTKTPRGKAIGSCGPTTSSRMDEFVPCLLRAGLKAMIGKGRRSREVVVAIKKYRAVYFLTYAGCGALLSASVNKKTLVAYPELGPEAIYRLEVKDFPVIVGVDSRGIDIFNKKEQT